MTAKDNQRYRQAAADYLHLPPTHPTVIEMAYRASQVAEMTAFEILRSESRRIGREVIVDGMPVS